MYDAGEKVLAYSDAVGGDKEVFGLLKDLFNYQVLRRLRALSLKIECGKS